MKAIAEKRKPWIKWYTRDWRSSAKLRLCSYAARGLWADLISLMGESPYFGILLVDDVVPTCRQLAALLGGTEREVAKLRAELGAAGVFSVTGFDMPEDVLALLPAGLPDGVLLSRRMIRDKAKADRDALNGRGGGNPKLGASVKGGVNPQANPQRSEVKGQKEDQETPSGFPLMDRPAPVAAHGALGAPAHDTTTVLSALGAMKRA